MARALSSDAITLSIPHAKAYHGVARLVVGGLAARLDLSYEHLEDLQLALESVLERDGYVAGEEVTVRLVVEPDAVAMVIGPLDVAELRRRSRPDVGRRATESRSPGCSRRSSRTSALEERRRRTLAPPREARAHDPPRAARAGVTRRRARTDRELLRRYHEGGDLEAREQLIERYLPLVRSLARRYANRGEQLEDLVQVGSIGLIKAIDRFDVDRGVELTTYATPNIIGEIKRHFRDKGWSIRVPRGLQELNVRLSQLLEQLTVELERSPTIPELAKAAGVTEEEVLEALESGQAYSTVSLSAPSGGGEDGELDPLESLGELEHEYEVSEDRAVLAPGLDVLDERERRILHLRFWEGLTQSQIAAQVGISQMHVSRLIRRSLEKIRDEIGAGRQAESSDLESRPCERPPSCARASSPSSSRRVTTGCPPGPLIPRRGRPLDPPHVGRDAAADAVLPRPRGAAGAADDDRAEVLPHARHRRGRAHGHHLTFFEMLGNFSFGDYFKDGAIELASEFVREHLADRPGADLGDRVRRRPGARARRGRGRDRAVGGDRHAARADRGAAELGELLVGRPAGAVRALLRALLRPGRGVRLRPTRAARPAASCDRFLEFWNLVFMEYDLHADRTLTPLPTQNIDTGLGVERRAAIMQGVHSVYETDGYQAIMDWIAAESGVAWDADEIATKAHRVLADHGRAMTFLVADGVTPSNEGRGYVLRRIIRRAVQQARKIGLERPLAAVRRGRRADGRPGTRSSRENRGPHREVARAARRSASPRRSRAGCGSSRRSRRRAPSRRGRLRADRDLRLPGRADDRARARARPRRRRGRASSG